MPHKAKAKFGTALARRTWQRRWFRLTVWSTLVTVVVLATFCLAVITWFKQRHSSEPWVYGVSFSKPYAESLDLDWRDTYQSLLTDLGFRHFRLMSYWDQHEPVLDQYDFADLDYQFNEAAKYGAKISLAIGLRQPRWPECREPSWAQALAGERWRSELTEYLATVLRRYRNHPALASWQLENEFGNQDFGRHCRDFDRTRLTAEAALVKQLDPNHPLIMNLSNQAGLPITNPQPDIYGFSAYQRVYEARFLKRYIDHPSPAWWHSFRAGLIEWLKQKPVIIHELQAEPWSTRPITETPFTEQLKTLSPEQLEANLRYAQATGIRTVYLWGGEWWYWRMVAHRDPSYWQIIEAAINQP
ncbi:beta-galactosidase [Candidatus Microgenomates bacterium]|nr:beta-galactosidase [Candidatus Microgenomates bacterium]